MYINTSKKEIQTTYTVKYVQFDENLTLYKIEIITGEKIGYQCGICLNSEINSLQSNPEIFKSELTGYYLWRKEVIEACKEDFHQLYNDFEAYMIKVNEIINHINDIDNFEDFVVLKWDGGNELFFEHNSEIPIPKTVYFDYTSGNVTNFNYNLKEALKILKTRNDIVIEKEEINHGIIPIPYYNCNEDIGENKYISFKWIPNQENWESVYKLPYFKKYEYILTKIFKIKRINN